MSIALTRVDFRLIHGQVITRWLKQCDINEIVTVDTALSKDEFMQDVLKWLHLKGFGFGFFLSKKLSQRKKMANLREIVFWFY